jgi:hypothetical protein
VIDEQHVLDLANEAALTAVETQMALNEYASYASVKDAHDDAEQALYIAIAALVVGAVGLGVLLGLCAFRLTAKKAFAEHISAVPLTSTMPTTASYTNGVDSKA